jgi:hypothetical protein
VSVYDTIRDEIFNHETMVPSSTPPVAASPHPIEASAATNLVAALSSRAANQSKTLHWQSSMIDLMQLLDLDSSIANRRRLAQELSYAGDETDSPAMDKWLHATVMNNLAGHGHQ